MRGWIALLLLGSAVCSPAAQAALPETGLYWNPDRPGVGYYVQAEGGTLVLVVYAHDAETGAPLFYTASGPIEPVADADGQFLFHGTLYRYSAGPCLTCVLPDWQTTEHAVAAGTITLQLGARTGMRMAVQMADGSSREDMLSRLRFDIASWWLYRWDWDLGGERRQLDLRGEWVFMLEDELQAPTHRFRFTGFHGPDVFIGRLFGEDFDSAEDGHFVDAVYFVDPESDAEMVCIIKGCAVRQHGETLFLFPAGESNIDHLSGVVAPAPGDEEWGDNDRVIGIKMPEVIPELAESPPGD